MTSLLNNVDSLNLFTERSFQFGSNNLFNVISTMFNAEILLNGKYLIVIITVFSMFHKTVFDSEAVVFKGILRRGYQCGV